MNNNIHLMNEAGTAKGGNPTTNMLPKNEKKTSVSTCIRTGVNQRHNNIPIIQLFQVDF